MSPAEEECDVPNSPKLYAGLKSPGTVQIHFYFVGIWPLNQDIVPGVVAGRVRRCYGDIADVPIVDEEVDTPAAVESDEELVGVARHGTTENGSRAAMRRRDLEPERHDPITDAAFEHASWDSDVVVGVEVDDGTWDSAVVRHVDGASTTRRSMVTVASHVLHMAVKRVVHQGGGAVARGVHPEAVEKLVAVDLRDSGQVIRIVAEPKAEIVDVAFVQTIHCTGCADGDVVCGDCQRFGIRVRE